MCWECIKVEVLNRNTAAPQIEWLGNGNHFIWTKFHNHLDLLHLHSCQMGVEGGTRTGPRFCANEVTITHTVVEPPCGGSFTPQLNYVPLILGTRTSATRPSVHKEKGKLVPTNSTQFSPVVPPVA